MKLKACLEVPVASCTLPGVVYPLDLAPQPSSRINFRLLGAVVYCRLIGFSFPILSTNRTSSSSFDGAVVRGMRQHMLKFRKSLTKKQELEILQTPTIELVDNNESRTRRSL